MRLRANVIGLELNLSKHKVIAVIEANVLTGPAKNLLRFAVRCREFVDLTVVTFIRPTAKDSNTDLTNEFIAAVRRSNLPIEVVRESGRFDLSALQALKRICERHKPNIVQTHGIKSHFLVSLFPDRKFGWIAFHHGYTSEDFKMKVYRQFNRWSLRVCDYVVAVCTPFAERLAEQGVRRERIVVVHNSVECDFVPPDAKQLAESRRQLAIPDDELVILSVGRLSREKGHKYLIDALSNVIRAAPEVKLQALIVGSGPEEESLRNLVAKMKLGNCVRFLGHRSDIKPLFAIADLFVLPSLSEGSPNVLLESMAARVPIVATSVGGVTEIVNHDESAILVRSANAGMLGKAMVAILQDSQRAKRLADVAFERVCSMFSPAKYDERMLALYERAAYRRF